jgi:hypothetical protein
MEIKSIGGRKMRDTRMQKLHVMSRALPSVIEDPEFRRLSKDNQSILRMTQRYVNKIISDTKQR